MTNLTHEQLELIVGGYDPSEAREVTNTYNDTSDRKGGGGS